MDRIVAYNGATTGIIYCLHISVGRAVKNGIPLSTDYNNIGNLLGSLIKYIYRAGRRGAPDGGPVMSVLYVTKHTLTRTRGHGRARVTCRASSDSTCMNLSL